MLLSKLHAAPRLSLNEIELASPLMACFMSSSSKAPQHTTKSFLAGSAAAKAATVPLQREKIMMSSNVAKPTEIARKPFASPWQSKATAHLAETDDHIVTLRSAPVRRRSYRNVAKRFRGGIHALSTYIAEPSLIDIKATDKRRTALADIGVNAGSVPSSGPRNPATKSFIYRRSDSNDLTEGKSSRKESVADVQKEAQLSPVSSAQLSEVSTCSIDDTHGSVPYSVKTEEPEPSPHKPLMVRGWRVGEDNKIYSALVIAPKSILRSHSYIHAAASRDKRVQFAVICTNLYY